MFDSPQAAQSAKESSPLRIPLPLPSQNDPKTASDSATKEANVTTDPSKTTPSSSLPPSSSQNEEDRSHLEIHIAKQFLPNNTLLHLTLLRQNPFYAPFEPDAHSPISTDLLRKLDRGLEGLADVPATQKKLFARARLMMGKNGEVIALKEKYGSLRKLWEGREADSDGNGNGNGTEEKRPKVMYAFEALEKKMWNVMDEIKLRKRKGLDVTQLAEEAAQLSKEMVAMEAMKKRTVKIRRKEGEARNFKRGFGKRFRKSVS